SASAVPVTRRRAHPFPTRRSSDLRSREARVPAVLEMLDIPFTGSDPLTMAVTLDKDVAKTVVAAAGVAVPGGYALAAHDSLADRSEEHTSELQSPDHLVCSLLLEQ